MDYLRHISGENKDNKVRKKMNKCCVRDMKEAYLVILEWNEMNGMN